MAKKFLRKRKQNTKGKKSKNQRYTKLKGQSPNPQQMVSKKNLKSIGKRAWSLIVGIGVILTIIGFSLYFRPRVSFSSAPSYAPYNAFKTPFVFKNEGNASIYNLEGNAFVTKLTFPINNRMRWVTSSSLDLDASEIEPNKEQTTSISKLAYINYPIDTLIVYFHFSYRGWGIPWQNQDWYCFEAQLSPQGYLWFQREINPAILDSLKAKFGKYIPFLK